MNGTELERKIEAARVSLNQTVENAEDIQEALKISRQLDELIADYVGKEVPQKRNRKRDKKKDKK